MPHEVTSDFRGGLDARKFKLNLPPGTLTALVNGHITQGAEIEKRKAFIKTAMPANTFGLEPLSNTQVVFGSGTTPGGIPAGYTYQQLVGKTGVAMTAIVCSTSYGNKTFAIALYADGSIYAFYDTVLIEDFVAGVEDIDFSTTTTIATALVGLVNRTAGYTAILGSGGNFNITSLVGQSFDVSLDATSAAGKLADQNISDTADAILAAPAVGQFQIVAGSGSTYASSTLTGVVSAGNTVTISGKVYTFVTPIGSTEGNVLLGANTTSSLANLVDAINHNSATAGVAYVCAAANTSVTAAVVTGVNYQIRLTAIVAGTAGNSIATTETSNLTFSPTSNLAGAVDNQITQVSACGVNILGAPVPFNLSVAQTATDIAVAINAYNTSNYTGFTASSAAGVVVISTVATDASKNGGAVIVTAKGNVCTGNCSFILGGTGFTISSITDAALVSLTSSDLTFTFPTNGATLALFNASLVANINANSTTYLAYTNGIAIWISKKVTSSNDSGNSIIVNGASTSGHTYSINGVSEGGTITTMTAVVSPNIETAVWLHAIRWGTANPFSVIITNGTAPYTYLWTFTSSLVQTGDIIWFSSAQDHSYYTTGNTLAGPYVEMQNKSGKPAYTVTCKCVVTDGNGNIATSNTSIISVPASP